MAKAERIDLSTEGALPADQQSTAAAKGLTSAMDRRLVPSRNATAADASPGVGIDRTARPIVSVVNYSTAERPIFSTETDGVQLDESVADSSPDTREDIKAITFGETPKIGFLVKEEAKGTKIVEMNDADIVYVIPGERSGIATFGLDGCTAVIVEFEHPADSTRSGAIIGHFSPFALESKQHHDKLKPFLDELAGQDMRYSVLTASLGTPDEESPTGYAPDPEVMNDIAILSSYLRSRLGEELPIMSVGYAKDMGDPYYQGTLLVEYEQDSKKILLGGVPVNNNTQRQSSSHEIKDPATLSREDTDASTATLHLTSSVESEIFHGKGQEKKQAVEQVRSMVNDVLRESFGVDASSEAQFFQGQLSTDPTEVDPSVTSNRLYTLCRTLSTELQKNLFNTKELPTLHVVSAKEGGNMHNYLLAKIDGVEVIIDVSIGQFLKGHNHTFVGTRDELYDLVTNQTGESKPYTIIHTGFHDNPQEAFERIWGYESKPYENASKYETAFDEAREPTVAAADQVESEEAVNIAEASEVSEFERTMTQILDAANKRLDSEGAVTLDFARNEEIDSHTRVIVIDHEDMSIALTRSVGRNTAMREPKPADYRELQITYFKRKGETDTSYNGRISIPNQTDRPNKVADIGHLRWTANEYFQRGWEDGETVECFLMSIDSEWLESTGQDYQKILSVITHGQINSEVTGKTVDKIRESHPVSLAGVNTTADPTRITDERLKPSVGQFVQTLETRALFEHFAENDGQAVKEEWQMLTGMALRELLDSDVARDALLQLTTQPVSEALPAAFIDKLAEVDPRFTRLAQKYRNNVGVYLRIPSIPDNRLVPDIRTAWDPSQYIITINRHEGHAVLQRYRFARDVELLILGAALQNERLEGNLVGYPDGDLTRYNLSNGIHIVIDSQKTEQVSDLLNPQTWERRSLYSAESYAGIKDRVSIIEAGGKKYVLKERKTPRHRDVKEGGYVESATSAEEFAFAKYFEKNGQVQADGVQLTWEKPIGYVTFPDGPGGTEGFQFALFAYEEGMTGGREFNKILTQQIEDHRELFEEEYQRVKRAAKKYLRDKRTSVMDAVPRPRGAKDVTFSEFAVVKSKLLQRHAEMLHEQVVAQNNFYTWDSDGFGFRTHIDPEKGFIVECVGFDFEYAWEISEQAGKREKDELLLDRQSKLALWKKHPLDFTNWWGNRRVTRHEKAAFLAMLEQEPEVFAILDQKGPNSTQAESKEEATERSSIESDADFLRRNLKIRKHLTLEEIAREHHTSVKRLPKLVERVSRKISRSLEEDTITSKLLSKLQRGDKLRDQLDILYQCWQATRNLPEGHLLTEFAHTFDSFEEYSQNYLRGLSYKGQANFFGEMLSFVHHVVHPGRAIFVKDLKGPHGGNDGYGVYFPGDMSDWIATPSPYPTEFRNYYHPDVMAEVEQLKAEPITDIDLITTTGSAAIEGITRHHAILSVREAIRRGEIIKTGEYATHGKDFVLADPWGTLRTANVYGSTKNTLGGGGGVRWFDEFVVTFGMPMSDMEGYISERGTSLIRGGIHESQSEGALLGSQVPLEIPRIITCPHMYVKQMQHWAQENAPHIRVISREAVGFKGTGLEWAFHK